MTTFRAPAQMLTHVASNLRSRRHDRATGQMRRVLVRNLARPTTASVGADRRHLLAS